jgi:hypothetical protein
MGYEMKWCTRCNKYHNSLPVDEKKLINNLSQQIADDIDNLVIEDLKAITEGASSIRVLKKDKKQGKGANSAV